MSAAEFDIMTVIGQMGFPIAVAIYLLYERTKAFGQTKEELKQMMQDSKDRNTLLLEVVRSNTAAQTQLQATIQKLCEIVNGKA